MTKVAFIRKLSGYFLCALLLLGNAWCTDFHDSPKTYITYFQAEVMKMEMKFDVPIYLNTSDTDNICSIAAHFESAVATFPAGKYSYFENRVYEHIKDPLALSTLRSQLNEIWNTSHLRGSQFCIIEAIFPGITVASEPVFEISSTPTIYIYYDKGVTDFSACACEEAIAALGSGAYVTQRITAEQTICGEWRRNAAAYLVPGGADLAFCEKLNGAGNAQIKDYVTAGGTYIGFCAGAYYGSHGVEFNKDGIGGSEVVDERELSFFPGSAVGPVLAPYAPTIRTGSRIAEIKWGANGEPSTQTYNVYYNGGCHFRNADQYPDVSVFATYDNEGYKGLSAIIRCQVGRGKAILSGVHPEYSAENLETLQPDLSAEACSHVLTNIIPGLSDGSHKDIFSSIMEQI